MVAWKINRIPLLQKDMQGCGNAYQFMRQILFSLQNFRAYNACLDLVYAHTVGEEVSVYIFLRNISNNGVLSSVEMQLATANYQFERLNYQSTAALSQRLIDVACTELTAVVKTEKIVTTPFMQENYYYWADALLTDENREHDNFTMLFQTLQQCDDSFVSFQLMPTDMQDYELNVLQYLNMHLEQHIRNMTPNTYGMSMYEPYAQPAYDAYRHYLEKRGQPVFQYNISIGSLSGNSTFLANQVIATIKTQTLNACELQAIPVRINRYEFNAENYPVYLLEILQKQYRDMFIWGGNVVPPNTLYRFPYLVTADEALLFFHLPYDDGKIVGIKGTVYQTSNELLDPVVTDGENIIFGQSANMGSSSVGAPAELFSQHMLIVGMPGTGKTTFSLNLLLQFHEKGIPFLAIEPTKAEYRGLIDAIPELQVFTPGNNMVSPFILNPFVPPKGIRLEKYIPSLYTAFKAAFDMFSPLDVIFLKAIRTTYSRYGWRDYSQAGDPEVVPFGFHEFIMVFQQIINESNYPKDIKGNLQSAGVFRLANIIEQNKYIFDTIRTISIEDILSKPTVIELNAIDDIELKALIMTLLLINIAVYTKSKQTKGTGLCNVVMLDEAHVLLDQKMTSNSTGQIDTQNYAVRMVENLIAEIRSFGTAIIIADQRPSAVGGPIVANTDIKIAFRLTSGNEKNIICESMDMNEKMRQQLSQLEKGQAYAFYHRMKKPQMVLSPNVCAINSIRKIVPDEEIRRRNRYWDDKQYMLKPYLLCQYCDCGKGCSFRLRADAGYLSNFIWDQKGQDIVDSSKLSMYVSGIPRLLKTKLEKYDGAERKALAKCVGIALQRKAALEKGISLDRAEMKKLLQNKLEEEVNHVFGN